MIARTTAMHYKGSHVDVARIRRELDVDYVVEGAVRRAEDHVAINVQLIQASDQSHLFAEKYNAVLRDLFAVENSIAQAIGANVNITATKTPPTFVVSRTARKPTQDLAAYDAYIRARDHLYRWTPEGLTKAKELFEQAIARDPTFALAYDGLAETYWNIGFLGFVQPKEAFSAGVFCALRAIEIDPTLAQTHALLGIFRKELDYNWAEVRREMKLALELDPESPVVRFRYAVSGLMPQGNLEQSAAELERALESDPSSLFMRVWLAEVLYLGRQYERSLEQCRSLMQLDPIYFLSHFIVGQIRCEQGLFDEAITVLRKAAELSGNAPLVVGWLGMTLARSGDAAGARQVLSGLHAAASQAYVLPTSFAWIHLGLGEIEQAYTCMERAMDERDPIIIPIKIYAFLDPLRNEPRFAAMLRKMNLASSSELRRGVQEVCMCRNGLILTILLVLLSAAPATLRAQVDYSTATLKGTILDPQGLVVGGARVTVTHPRTGWSRAVQTGAATVCTASPCFRRARTNSKCKQPALPPQV